MKNALAENKKLADGAKSDSGETVKRMTDMQRRIDDLSRNKEHLIKEIESLNHSHEQSIKQHAANLTAELEKARQISNKQVERYQTAESNYKKTLAELADSRTKCQSLESLHASLMDNLAADATEAGNLRSKIADLENILSDKDIKIKSLSLDNRNLLTDSDRLKKELSKVNDRLDAQIPIISSQKDDVKRLNSELLAVREECDKVKRQLDLSMKDGSKLNDKIERQKTTIAAKDQEIVDLKASWQDLTSQLRDTSRRHSVSKTDSEAYSKRVAEQDSILNKLKDQNSQLRENDVHLKRKLESSRVKNEELEKRLQASEDDWKARLKQKDKIIRELTNQSVSLKTEWASDIRKKDVQTSGDIDDVRKRYEMVIQDLRESILQEKDDHAHEIEELREVHLNDSKAAAARQTEEMYILRRENELFQNRKTQEMEALINKMTPEDGDSDMRNQMEELYQVKLDQARADLERKYQEDTENLISDKIELNAEINRVNNEILRLRELYENIKSHHRSDYVTPSASNSRAGSFNSIRRDTSNSGIVGLERGRSKVGSQRRKSGIAPGSTYQVEHNILPDLPLDRESYTAKLDEEYKIEYAADPTRSPESQMIEIGGSKAKRITGGAMNNFPKGELSRRSHIIREKESPSLTLDINRINSEPQNGHVEEQYFAHSKLLSDRNNPKSSSYSPALNSRDRFPQKHIPGIQTSPPNRITFSSGQNLNAQDTHDLDHDYQARPSGYDFTFKKPQTPTEHPSVTNRLDFGSPVYGTHRNNVINGHAHTGTIFDRPSYLQSLTSLRKARILNNAMQHVMANHKRKAFYSLIESRIKRLRGWGEAGNRVKGRMLLMLKTRYADVPVRRSFLKWAMLTNKDFVRNCIVKIALTSKINEESVFWRFRKGIEKRMQNRIPESAKKARHNLGSHILHYLFKIVQKNRRIEVFNTIRPRILGKENTKLNRVLMKTMINSNLSLLLALRQLRSFSMRQPIAINRLASSLHEKQRNTLRSLRGLNLSQKEGNDMTVEANEVLLMTAAIRRAVSSNIQKSLEVENLNRRKPVTAFIVDRLRLSSAALQRSAIHKLHAINIAARRLSDHRQKAYARIFNAVQDHARERLLESYHKMKVNSVGSSLKAKIDESQIRHEGQKRSSCSRSFTNHISAAADSKRRSAFENLLRHSRLLAAEKDRALAMQTKDGLIKSKLVKKLIVAQRLKTNAACTGLLQFCNVRDNLEKLKNKKLVNLLNKLATSSVAKTQVALLDLKQWNFEEQMFEENRRALAMESNHLKTSILAQLLNSSSQKLRQSLDYLRNFKIKEDQRIQFKKAQSQLVASRLSSIGVFKQRMAMAALKENSLKRASSETAQKLIEINRKMHLFILADKIASALAKTQTIALENLRAHSKKEAKQEEMKLGSMKSLISLLAKNTNIKQAESFNRLVRYHIHHLSTAATTSTIRYSTIHRLVHSMIDKTRYAYMTMVHHKRNRDIIHGTSMEVKKAAVSRLMNSIDHKCYHSLGVLRAWQRHKDKQAAISYMHIQSCDRLKSGLLSKLAHSQSAKLRDSLLHLRSTNTQASDRDRIRLQRISGIAKYIAAGSRHTQMYAFLTLYRHNIEYDRRQHIAKAAYDRSSTIRHAAISRLVRSIDTKQRSAFNTLADHTSRMRIDARVDCNAYRLMANRLVSANNVKIRDVFNRLHQHCDMNKSYIRMQAIRVGSFVNKLAAYRNAGRLNRVKQCIDTMREFAMAKQKDEKAQLWAFSTLKAAQNHKVKAVLHILKSFNFFIISESRLSESIMDNVVQQEMVLSKRLSKKLVNGLKNKCAMTLKTLKYFNAEKNDHKKREAEIIKSLQKMISQTALANKHTVVDRMKLHSRLDKDYRQYLYTMCSRITKRFEELRRAKMRQSLKQMTQNANDTGSVLHMKQKAARSLILKAQSASSAKQQQCLSTMSYTRASHQISNRLRQRAASTLAVYASRASRSSLRDAMQAIVQRSSCRSSSIGMMSSMADRLLNDDVKDVVASVVCLASAYRRRLSLINKFRTLLISRNELKVNEAMQKLLLNCAELRLRQARQVRLVNMVERSMKHRAEKGLERLKLHQVLERLLVKVRRIKLASIVSQAQSHLFREAYNKLAKNWRDKERLYRLLVKYSQRAKTQAAYSAFGRWNMIRGFENKRLIDHRVLVVVNLLEKNRRIATRQAFNRWKMKLKTDEAVYKKVSTILETLLSKAKQHAFDKVYHKSQFEALDHKTKCMRNMLMILHEMATRRKQRIFHECKSLFHVDNKWYKMVIYIWTQKSRLNQQKAFWRIKDEKILGLSSVATSKAVKLRAIMNIINQKEKEKKASAFSTISYSTVLKSWQHSMSLSPAKRYNEDPSSARRQSPNPLRPSELDTSELMQQSEASGHKISNFQGIP